MAIRASPPLRRLRAEAQVSTFTKMARRWGLVGYSSRATWGGRGVRVWG